MIGNDRKLVQPIDALVSNAPPDSMSYTDQTKWVDLSDFGPTKGSLGTDPSSEQQGLGDYCLRTTFSISLLEQSQGKAEMGSRYSFLISLNNSKYTSRCWATTMRRSVAPEFVGKFPRGSSFAHTISVSKVGTEKN